MSKRIPKNLLRAWEFKKKKNQQLEEQLKQQQQQQWLIKNLPWHIKNKKSYFITDIKENENDYENDD